MKTRLCVVQITGMSSTFNSTSLKATIFLPKDEAFTALLSTLGMTLDQALNASSPFTPFLGQVTALRSELLMRGLRGLLKRAPFLSWS